MKTQVTKKTRAIVTSCDLAFTDGASALLQGVARHHPDIRRYCFVPPEDRDAIETRLGSIAEVRSFPRPLKGVPDKFLANAGRVFTACVDETISAYFDADMLICGDISAVWEIREHSINAVQDDALSLGDNLSSENKTKMDMLFPGFTDGKGFNGGLFALNTQEYRDLPERFENIIEKAGLEYDYILDQPLLNAIFQPNVNYLPRKYNSHCIFDSRIPKDVCVVHYTSAAKPWMSTFPKHEPSYWYWLKHGLPQASAWRLLVAKLWIIINTPKRLLGRRLKRKQ